MIGRVPSRGSDQFNLRLPDGMRDEIAKAAAHHGRSMNAEIVSRLQWTFEKAAPVAERLEEVESNLSRVAKELEALVKIGIRHPSGRKR